MNNFLPIYKRELRSFFSGSTAYILIVSFLLISGVFFTLIINDYSKLSFEVIRSNYQFEVENLSLAEGVMSPMFRTFSFVLLIMIPVLTMRSFSEEKKSGTMELMFTYPVTDGELLLGKFFAVFTVLASMIGCTLAYIPVLLYFDFIPFGAGFAGYFGLLLLGAVFISIGIFASSLTENQIASATISFGLIMFFWMIGWLGGDSTMPIAEIFRYLSLLRHFEAFSAGVIDSRDVIYYLSVIFLFALGTLKVLESRRYR